MCIFFGKIQDVALIALEISSFLFPLSPVPFPLLF